MISGKKIYLILFFMIMLVGRQLSAQQQRADAFQVIPLGIKGGLDESNLSAYLIAPLGSSQFICADAGTVRHGIDIAISHKVFSGNAGQVLKKQVKGYLISHAHLDHVAGMLMNAPEDSVKNVYAIPSVIGILKDKYFNWKAWGNFTNEGDLPQLKKYSYVYLGENKWEPLAGTEMEVTPFILSHGPSYQSTAFLIRHKDAYLLYLGDTGADQIEKNNLLSELWKEMVPLVNSGQLKAIFIETSFPDEQPDNQLFGHLTPKLLMTELGKLNKTSKPGALQKVAVVITHMKAFGLQEKKLKAELLQDNGLQLKLVFPEQGRLMKF